MRKSRPFAPMGPILVICCLIVQQQAAGTRVVPSASAASLRAASAELTPSPQSARVNQWAHSHSAHHHGPATAVAPAAAAATPHSGHHHHYHSPARPIAVNRPARPATSLNYSPSAALLALPRALITTTTTSGTTTSTPTSATSPLSSTAAYNLTELCSHANADLMVDKQLLAYVSSIEAMAGSIQEIDEAVQQIKPRSCEAATLATSGAPSGRPEVAVRSSSSPLSESVGLNVSESNRATGAPLARASDWSWQPAASAPATVELTSNREDTRRQESSTLATTSTTMSFLDPETPAGESFLDSPVAPVAPVAPSGRFERRAKRAVELNSSQTSASEISPPSQASGSFGMPTNAANGNQDLAHDLAKASSDLRALRKDLSSAAEWLRQTNHNVHSALLRALVTYVSSVERRIENHRSQFVAQALIASLKSKVAVVKEKMTILLEKLKAIIPHKNNGGAGNGGNGANGDIAFNNDASTIVINRSGPSSPVAATMTN